MKGKSAVTDMITKYKDIFTIAIAVCALFVSVRGCVTSKQSLEISKQSLEISNRPYLALKPVKFHGTNSYLKITADYEKKTISVKTTFDMTNYGKTPAINIKCPQNAQIVLEGIDKPINQHKKIPFQYFPCPDKNIAPGETSYMTLEMLVGKKDDKALEVDYKWLASGEGFVRWEIPLTYSDILDGTKEYITMVSYKIYKDRFEWGKSEIK